jgi:hypothetical protein
LLDFSLWLQHPSTFLLRYFNWPFCDLNSVVITTVYNWLLKRIFE